MHKLFLHPPRPNLSCQCNAREQMNIQRPGLLLARPRTAPMHLPPRCKSSMISWPGRAPSSANCSHRPPAMHECQRIALVLLAPTNPS